MRMLAELVRRYVLPQRSLLAAILVLQIAQILATLWLPTLNASVIDDGIAAGDVGLVWRLGGLMLAVALVQVIANVVAVVAGAVVAMRAARSLRSGVYGSVMDYGGAELSRFGSSSLITRATNDVRQVQMLIVMALTMVVMAPFMALGGLAMALSQDLGLSLVILATVAVLIAVLVLVVRRMVPSFRVMQERVDAVTSVVSQQLGGLRVIRAFTAEDRERARFSAVNSALTDAGLAVGRWFVLLFPAVMGIVSLGSVAVVWFGGLRADAGSLDVGVVLAFVQYLMLILMGVTFVAFIGMMIPRAEVSAGRLVEVLDAEVALDAESGTLETVPEPGALELDRVTFSYAGAAAPVLREVTVSASPGEVLAVIGATGSGKTTLAQLVLRLLEPTSGTVRVGGANVSALSPAAYGAQFAYVPQTPQVLGRSVADNLRLGAPEATDAEIRAALEAAQAWEFVAELPEGSDTVLAQGGRDLSGGQRQRIAIAMALVRRAPVLVLDDSLSALDTRTDAAVRRALAGVESTVLLITQRVSAAEDADRVLVLDDGAPAGLGTHAELLASSPVYAEIVDSQTGAAA
ncbi:ABC transporter ATP-binding protein [Brevibacterium album]|uniref:ABC transporter ATP-binding protein n=1 Tax=Brevibacterium album TaxID=417948 RepID=UPI00041E9ED6|nr:ABC transporter ATP-binding protein [Brevibacterium album]